MICTNCDDKQADEGEIVMMQLAPFSSFFFTAGGFEFHFLLFFPRFSVFLSDVRTFVSCTVDFIFSANGKKKDP